MDKTVKQIREAFEKISILDLPNKIKEYENDGRVSVRKMISVYNKKYESYIIELDRVEKLKLFENKYYEKGIEYIAGVDEVGRGPLAGPVLAAAVVLRKDCVITGVNDSKKLSENRREDLFKEIKQKAVSIGIGIVSHEVIDDINIKQATLLAMKQAIEELEINPQAVLVDAETVPGLNMPQEAIIKGDEKSISIAAASIVAKVTRDAIMREYSLIYPEYGFDRNKGYGSEEHMRAIDEFGIGPIHRKSFTVESKSKPHKL